MVQPTRRRILAAASALPALTVASRPLRAQLPDRPIRIICPWAPGGAFDAYLRGFVNIARRHLDRTMVVENRAGASGSIGMAYAKNQAPDGTVICGATDASWRITMVQQVEYDPLKDFTYLAATNNLALGWAVLRDSPIRDLKDLVERARAKPEGISYAGSGTPANPPFGMKLLEFRAQINFLFVPFAGAGPAANALMSRDVDVMYDTLGGIAGLLESGDVRLLATTAKDRLARYPAVPTAKEQGFDVEFDYASGFVAPRGMSDEIANLLTDGIQRTVRDPEHETLLARLHLTPWWRGRTAYAEYVATMLRDQPPLLRAMGVIR